MADPGCELRSHVAISWPAVWRVPCWALGMQGGQIQLELPEVPWEIAGLLCVVYPVPWEQGRGTGVCTPEGVQACGRSQLLGPRWWLCPPVLPACPALGGAQWRKWGRQECLVQE